MTSEATVTDVPKYIEVPKTKKWDKGNKKIMNPEYIALWESYLDEGMSAKAVAEIFGVAKSTVLDHYPGRGWDAAQKLEHSFSIRKLNRMKNTM